ncbi:hypothetical protein ABTK17_19940, partial [Acinetobacter baumannii]
TIKDARPLSLRVLGPLLGLLVGLPFLVALLFDDLTDLSAANPDLPEIVLLAAAACLGAMSLSSLFGFWLARAIGRLADAIGRLRR